MNKKTMAIGALAAVGVLAALEFSGLFGYPVAGVMIRYAASGADYCISTKECVVFRPGGCPPDWGPEVVVNIKEVARINSLYNRYTARPGKGECLGVTMEFRPGAKRNIGVCELGTCVMRETTVK